MSTETTFRALRFWCQKVLPLVYDDSLSYYELLSKYALYINNLIDSDKTIVDDLENLKDEVDNIEAFVDLTGVIGQGESNLLFVTKTGGRFNTINAAINYAKTYCSLNNRVTIAIVGGQNCVYEEYVDLTDNPGIDLFGISNPTIRSHVAWPLSTLVCNTDISCEGITFQNIYTPQSAAEYAGYALHADPTVGSQKYFNCMFNSDHNAGVGIGMATNGEITFSACKFISSVESVYMHNNGLSGSVNQWIRYFDCIFETTGANQPCIRVYDVANAIEAGRQSQMGLIFNNCSAYPSTTVKYEYDNQHSVTYIPSQARVITQVGANNIFLVSASSCPGIPGVDFAHNVMRVYDSRVCISPAYYYIPMVNAYRYSFRIIQANVSRDGGNTWTAADTSNAQLSADTTYPDTIRVVWNGVSPSDYVALNIEATYVG